VKLTAAELLELNLEDQIENSYAFRPAAVGLEDVEAGYRPLYPVTVYQVSGDDTSGIAGMLMPDGSFLEIHGQRREAAFWEFDETLFYERVRNLHKSDINPDETRVAGNSWTTGAVLWDGSSGPIMPLVEMEVMLEANTGQKDNGSNFVKKPTLVQVTVHQRLVDTNTLIGESEALDRKGATHNRKPGVLHLAHIATNSAWAA
jgi:hypothetical protein